MNTAVLAHGFALTMMFIASLPGCGPMRPRAHLPPPRRPFVTVEDTPLRRAPPSPLPSREHALPHIERFVLPNGLTVFLVPQPGAADAAVRLICRRCGEDDPNELSGLASLSMRTMVRTALGGHRRIEGLHISGSAGLSAGGFSVTVPRDRLADGVRILATVVAQPTLSHEAFEAERVAMQQEWEHETHRALVDLLVATMFGREHVYGRRFFELRSTLLQATLPQADSFRRNHLLLPETALVVAADVDRETLEHIARVTFSGWPGAAPVAHTVGPTTPMTPRVLFLDIGPSPLVYVIVAMPGVRRDASAYAPLLVIERLLGGQLGSRLNLSLREQQGLIYASDTAIASFRDAGLLVFETRLEGRNLVPTLRGLMNEIRRVHDTAIEPEELRAVQRAWRASNHAQFEDPDNAADAVEDIFTNGLGDDEFSRLEAQIDALTPESLLRAAQRHLVVSRAMTLVVGDGRQFGSAVREEFGLTEIIRVH